LYIVSSFRHPSRNSETYERPDKTENESKNKETLVSIVQIWSNPDSEILFEYKYECGNDKDNSKICRQEEKDSFKEVHIKND